MAPVLLANSELVACAWIASIAGMTADGVATQLPDEAAWAANGFITVRVIGGSPAVYLPVAAPVLQLDCYATKLQSNKPPWFKAAGLAEQVRRGCRDRVNFNRPLALSSGGVAYPPAVAEDATLLTEPRRGYADRADYALYTLDLRLTWKTVGERLA